MGIDGLPAQLLSFPQWLLLLRKLQLHI